MFKMKLSELYGRGKKPQQQSKKPTKILLFDICCSCEMFHFWAAAVTQLKKRGEPRAQLLAAGLEVMKRLETEV